MTLATLNFAVKNVDHNKVFKVALKDIESKNCCCHCRLMSEEPSDYHSEAFGQAAMDKMPLLKICF